MAQFLLFNGALNGAVLGLPAYIWIMLFVGLLLAASNAVWYFFFWMPLKPVHGHFTSHIHKTNSALTFNENLDFMMRSEKKAKLIFDMKVADAKKEQKDWEVAPSGLIGRVLNDLIFDGGGWLNLESPVRAEIERVAATHNEANPDDPVLTLGKFHKYLCAGMFGECPTILRTYRVDWKRIDFAIPEKHIQPMWDGYLGQLARKMEGSDTEDFRNYGYIMLAVSALICLAMLAFKFLK